MEIECPVCKGFGWVDTYKDDGLDELPCWKCRTKGKIEKEEVVVQ